MDIQNYTTEHRKGQHLSAEERHEIEVRLKDGWSPYRIAKHLGRAYNTIKNENYCNSPQKVNSIRINLLALQIIVSLLLKQGD